MLVPFISFCIRCCIRLEFYSHLFPFSFVLASRFKFLAVDGFLLDCIISSPGILYGAAAKNVLAAPRAW